VKDRDLLLGSLDISLAFLVVFLLAFFGIRYDESQGPFGELSRLDAVDSDSHSDLGANGFLGVLLDGERIFVSRSANHAWAEHEELSGPSWRTRLRYHLDQSTLPVVVYEINYDSPLLGEVIREAAAANRTVGLSIEH